MQVSIFKNLKTFVADKSISGIISEIKNGLVKDDIILLRQLIAEGKTKEYDEQKKALLAFTPSGTFAKRRKLEFLKEYSGFIVLDIDDLGTVLLTAIKENAIKNPYTYACFISPGGEGLKIIVKTNATSETHKSTFSALTIHFEEYLNVFIDPSGKDIPRLCLYSYDAETYLNENASIYTN